eukprot:TRINITY_DN113986_c0_g1_i1.p1 TRINITY_DN113986_c0_g1~~TRINITY_DN113986_c0_g1_i1.p1  ORF type:complete len:326 (+),score=72.23 TRINITY_DN113986_c0_g1_i1:133-1110(+)
MGLPPEVQDCLREAKVALSGLEAAMEGGMVAREKKLEEAQRAARESLSAVKAAEKEIAHLKVSLQVAEDKVERLEAKLIAKRDEVALLQKQLSHAPSNGADRPVSAQESRVSVAEPRRQDSASAPHKAVGSRSRSRRSPSLADRRDARRDPPPAKAPEPPLRKASLSRSVSSRGHRERDARRERRMSPPPARRSRTPQRARSRRHRSRSLSRSARRSFSDSRSRSNSRRGRGGDRGGKSRGKGGGGKDGARDAARDGRDVPLCIAFVMGNCHRGNQCRDRHPDEENCKSARETLLNKICRFGNDCKRRDCIFKHPGKENRDSQRR